MEIDKGKLASSPLKEFLYMARKSCKIVYMAENTVGHGSKQLENTAQVKNMRMRTFVFHLYPSTAYCIPKTIVKILRLFEMMMI